MATSPDGHPTSQIVHDVDAWVLAAQEQRAKLHIQAAGPWQSNERYEAFAQMSELLLNAFEEMRLVSEALREGSQGIRRTSADLRMHSTQLIERGTTLRDRMAQLHQPPPEEIRQSESQMLNMFKGESHRDR